AASGVLEGLVARGADATSVEQVQRLFTAAFQLYWQNIEAGKVDSPFSPRTRITATQVAHVALRLLRHQNLEIFELAAWQSWGGEPWDSPVWRPESYESGESERSEERRVGKEGASRLPAYHLKKQKHL